MKKILSLLFLFFYGFVAQAQYKIHGTISDTKGEPLFGAGVFIHELSRGTTTGPEGSYEIKNLKSGTYHLHITYLGYEAESKSITIKQENLQLDYTLKASSLEMKELVIESDPFKSGPVEQSMTIETVDKKFLEKNSGNTFINTLEKLPGINSINTGVGISKPVIRGMSSNRVVVIDRGIKQEGQQWGSDHGLEIDQFDPERVEIIKGPASLMYGSDGIAGVINILPPVLPEAGEYRAEVTSLYKSNNDLGAVSAMGEMGYKSFSARLRISGQNFGDYRVPADSFVYNSYRLPITGRRLKNTAGREQNFSLTAGIKKDWGIVNLTVSNFHQKAGLFAGATGVPRSYQLTHDGDYRNVDIPRQVNNHLKVIANAKILFKRNWLEAEAGYQDNYRREEAKPHLSGGNVDELGTFALGLRLRTWSANLKYYQQLSEGHKRINGLQMQYQTNEQAGFEFLLPDFNALQGGAFWYEEYSLSKSLTLNGGLRFDYGNVFIHAYEHPYYTREGTIRYEQKTTDVNRNFVNLSGATGLSYYPSHQLNIKLNLGSSFRMPSPAELSMNGLHHGTFRYERGDSTLQSERGWQADLNFNWHNDDDRLWINVTPFFNYFNRFIYLAPSPTFANVGYGETGQLYQYKQNQAVFSGAESSLEYHLLEALHLQTSFEYVWNLNLDSGLPLPLTPPYSLKSEAEYEFDWANDWFSDFYLKLEMQHSGAQNRVDRNERPTPGYTLLNIGTGFELKAAGQPIQFRLSVQNLTNTKYMNHLSRYRLLNLPEQGRNFNVMVKLPISGEYK